MEVGDFIVEHADIVVALWDGKIPQGPGGTGDVVARALRAEKPVLVIDPTNPAARKWLGSQARDVDAIVTGILKPLEEGGISAGIF